ncbi:hypothetical protein GCM10010358_65930 [Streptomyces minutiscleroticus]|uniref:Transposase n=1 Tax=Streptomyces minutiscleroticus TaxID=68238 RepID=A0A918NWP6_9ACTN|nr:hypothetical protein GCM10010358_65930 [Streptomyces minutiscleroticus]
MRVLTALPVRMSRHTALRVLMNIPLPKREVPEAVGVDDFAPARRHR